MSVRKAIYDIIEGYNDGSIWPLVAPQETEGLYHTYSMRMEPIRSQDGVFGTTVFLTINSYSNDWSQLSLQAESIYALLEGVTGTYEGETVHSSNWIGEEESYIPDLDKFVITQDFEIIFQ